MKPAQDEQSIACLSIATLAGWGRDNIIYSLQNADQYAYQVF
jgi:hypothetical protein